MKKQKTIYSLRKTTVGLISTALFSLFLTGTPVNAQSNQTSESTATWSLRQSNDIVKDLKEAVKENKHYYTMKQGDTLAQIAKAFNEVFEFETPIKWEQLRDDNHIQDERKIPVGTKIAFYTDKTHTTPMAIERQTQDVVVVTYTTPTTNAVAQPIAKVETSKPEAKPEVKDKTSKPEVKPEAKDEASKPEDKPEVKDETSKPEVKPEVKDETSKPEDKAEVKDETSKPEDKAEVKDETSKPEDKPEVTDETSKPEVKTEVTDETSKPEDKTEVKDETSKPEDKTEVTDETSKPEDKTEVTDETSKPEDKAEVTDETSKPEDKTEVADETSKPEDKTEVTDETSKPEDKPEVKDETSKPEDKPEAKDETSKPEDEAKVKDEASKPEDKTEVTDEESNTEDESNVTDEPSTDDETIEIIEDESNVEPETGDKNDNVNEKESTDIVDVTDTNTPAQPEDKVEEPTVKPNEIEDTPSVDEQPTTPETRTIGQRFNQGALIDLNKTYTAFFKLLNEARSALGYQPLEMSTILQQGANTRAQELAEIRSLTFPGYENDTRYNGHTRENGDSWSTAYDYTIPFSGGETLSIQPFFINKGEILDESKIPTEDEVAATFFNSWKNSPAHFEILTDPDFYAGSLSLRAQNSPLKENHGLTIVGSFITSDLTDYGFNKIDTIMEKYNYKDYAKENGISYGHRAEIDPNFEELIKKGAIRRGLYTEPTEDAPVTPEDHSNRTDDAQPEDHANTNDTAQPEEYTNTSEDNSTDMKPETSEEETVITETEDPTSSETSTEDSNN